MTIVSHKKIKARKSVGKWRKYKSNTFLSFDKSVKKLGNCYYLNLSGCKFITNASVKLLGNCYKLDLRECNRITDKSVQFLTNCKILKLSWTNVTDLSVY